MENQIECPVCGVMIDVDDNSGLKIECPNCHEMVENTSASESVENKSKTAGEKRNKQKTNKRKTHSSPEYTIIGDNDFKNSSTGNDGFSIDVVVKSKFDEDGVKKELIKALVEKDFVPSDIFDGLNMAEVRKYYLPYQLLEGTYQVPWDAIYQWDEYVDYVENGEKKTMRQKQHGESNGTANGEFSYLHLVCDKDCVPPKIFKMAQNTSNIQQEEKIPYSSDIREDDKNVIVMPNSNFETIWKNKISKGLLAKGKHKAEEQARSNEAGIFLKTIGTGASLQSYNFQVNYHITLLETLLIPFWYVDYTYQKKHYLFIMDAEGKSKELEAPKNIEEFAEVEKNEKKKTGCVIDSIILLLFASSIILGWICGSWLLFLGLAAISIILLFWAANKDGKVNDLNEEIKNENKKRRQEMAQGLLGDFTSDIKPQVENKKENVGSAKPSGSDDYLDSII